MGKIIAFYLLNFFSFNHTFKIVVLEPQTWDEICRNYACLIKKKLLTSERISVSDVGANAGSTQICVVCKKEARLGSIFCSNDCIIAHAKESTKEKASPVPLPTKIQKNDSTETPKSKEHRLIVVDRKTKKIFQGRFFSFSTQLIFKNVFHSNYSFLGSNGPQKGNVQRWLKEHPNYELVHANTLHSFKMKVRTPSDSPKVSIFRLFV